MSRLNDFTDALRNPHAWVGAIFIATLATVPTGLLDKLGETPRNTEAQQADEIEQAHRRADQDAAAARERALMCGSENAVGIPSAKGIECRDKLGRKTKTIPGLARPANTTPDHAARALGARLQRDVLKAPFQTKSAGPVPAGFLKG